MSCVYRVNITVVVSQRDGRFLNHSCCWNLALQLGLVKDRSRLGLVINRSRLGLVIDWSRLGLVIDRSRLGLFRSKGGCMLELAEFC